MLFVPVFGIFVGRNCCVRALLLRKPLYTFVLVCRIQEWYILKMDRNQTAPVVNVCASQTQF